MSHHQTCPQFYEEIKVELPPNIHDGHHVKIVIYHVSVDPKKTPKKSGMESVLTEIGSSWIRLAYRRSSHMCGSFHWQACSPARCRDGRTISAYGICSCIYIALGDHSCQLGIGVLAQRRQVAWLGQARHWSVRRTATSLLIASAASSTCSDPSKTPSESIVLPNAA